MAQSVLDRLKQAPKAVKVATTATPTELSELEQQVFNFVKQSKFLLNSTIPLRGASTVEIAEAFPHVNSNTLRYTVWHLRKKNKLVDTGIKRSKEQGKVGVVVWEAVGE